MKPLLMLLGLVLLWVGGESVTLAQQALPSGYRQTPEQEIGSLRSEVAALRRSVADTATEGAVAFLFGAFCALWAQNSNRSAWLWFFLGFIFSVIAVIVLLVKNSRDRRRRG